MTPAEVKMTPLDQYPALVLNADYRPLSYFPLSLWSWQDAVHAAFGGRVDVVAEYDREIRPPSFRMMLPSVIALRDYVPLKRKVALTRFNIFLRDSFECGYCGQKFSSKDLTFDHVVPKLHGGTTCFTNILSACAQCNARKANRTPKEAGMVMLKRPTEPTAYELYEKGRKFRSRTLHETWRDFLYWNVELDPV
jgi:5-methylcytosine-specific restriction endonuclease McrA